MNYWVDIDIKHYIKQLYVKEQFCYECQVYLSCEHCYSRLCKRQERTVYIR